MLDLDAVRQRADYTCGVACARSVLRYYGRSEQGVGRILRACRRNGTPADRLAKLFLAHNLDVAMRAKMRPADLQTAIRNGKPVIVSVEWREPDRTESHWQVVRGLRRRRVYLMCPILGLTDRPLTEFCRRWEERFGIIVG